MTWNRRRAGISRTGRWRRKGPRENQIDYALFDNAKGATVRELKDAKQKRDRFVATRIRKAVFGRDPACIVPQDPRWPHDGPDEWAHMEEGTRARTRGKLPETRHTTRLSCRLCRAHHSAYDRGVLLPKFLSGDGADGPMAWSYQGETVGGGR